VGSPFPSILSPISLSFISSAERSGERCNLPSGSVGSRMTVNLGHKIGHCASHQLELFMTSDKFAYHSYALHDNWLHGPRYAENRAPWGRHYFGGEGRVEPLNIALCALHMMSTTVSRVVQNSSDSLPAPFLWTVIIAIMLSTGGKGKM